MPGATPLIVAIVATAAALLANAWWFGVHRRRLAETRAGVQALHPGQRVKASTGSDRNRSADSAAPGQAGREARG